MGARHEHVTTDAATRRRVALTGFFASLGFQLALIGLGVSFVFAPEALASLYLLLAWCICGTVYLVGVWAVLWAASRFPASDAPPLLLEIGLAPRLISQVATLLVCSVGVAAAVQHIFLDPTSPTGWSANLVGIWAMILAWALLHWGFAQLYLQQYYRAPSPTLRFPGDDKPGILEFAYLAYGLAVSLAVSDVEILARPTRWRVLTHTVLGFFFNGLIVVMALTAIAEIGGLR